MSRFIEVHITNEVADSVPTVLSEDQIAMVSSDSTGTTFIVLKDNSTICITEHYDDIRDRLMLRE